MTRALVLSEHDLDGYGAGFAAGTRPSRLPYGLEALEMHGFRLGWPSGAREPRSRKVRDVIEHRSGMTIDRPVRSLCGAWASDVVLALLEPQGMMAAAAKSWHVPPYSRRPLVIWSCWLADDLQRGDRERRRSLIRKVRRADLITCMTQGEAPVLLDAGLRPEQVMPIPFGVSVGYYHPSGESRDIPVLAVGQDRGRDYATLFEAVRDLDVRVRVVCKPWNVDGLDVPANVELTPPVGISTYRALLRRAQIVVVPTHDHAYPTGQSVALEASATGACVVATATSAMQEYLHDHVDARLVPLHSPDGWRATVSELLTDPEQRERLGAAALVNVSTRFTTERMWNVVAEAMTAHLS